ncbi:type I secretion system permease/ATPase [Stappia sediminis]
MVPKQSSDQASASSQHPSRPQAFATSVDARKKPATASPEASSSGGQAAAEKPEPVQVSAGKTGKGPDKPEQAKAETGKAEEPSPDVRKQDHDAGGKQTDASRQKADGAKPQTDGAAEGKARADTATRPSDMATGATAKMETRNSTPAKTSGGGGDSGSGGAGGGGGGNGGNQSPKMQKRFYDDNFRNVLTDGLANVRKNLITIGVFSFFVNLIVLCVPIYLFQISDRVLTSRSTDTLIMLTIIVVGALAIHVLLDMVRRMILMRVAVDTETRLGPSVLSAAAKASQNGSNREYQVLHDLQSLRNFITGPVLLTFFDLPVMPLYLLVVFLIHPDLGYIVAASGAILMTIALINQKFTAVPFGRANAYATRANLQADAMSRNAQVINAMGMIPEGVQLWGRETLESLKAQVQAQDYNVMLAGISKFSRLCTQIAILGWGAYLALHSEITGGMLIAASIIGSRALAPIEGAIEGWRGFIQARSSYARIRTLLVNSPLNLERLRLPRPRGKVSVERVLYVPPPSKKVILNGISFELEPGESMAIVGSSGAGKSTLARMLVGSIVPTAGNIRLDHMDLRNWDPRQFGESVGYLPQDVQLFPATIKANIARMRDDASDDAIFDAAETADVHEMISQFSAGYETMIGLDGSPLSGGQKQRIGLARAFFGDPRMVVLDEPNSNLDSPGELALARALKRAKAKEITVIAITQRPTLLKSVDKIMLLKGGTVQAMGKRNDMLELLRNNLPDAKGKSTKSLPRK